MKFITKYGFYIAIAGVFLYFNLTGDSDGDITASDIDLNRVLDVTVETLYQYEESLPEDTAEVDADAAFLGLSNALATDYNAQMPALHEKNLGVSPQENASMIAYEDLNQNALWDENEDGIFIIEIDGENSRIIATSRSGAINDHHFSGTSLLTGFLIGSLLSRQLKSGVDPKSLSSKQPVSAKSAAKARAGSGSYSSGK